MTKSFSKTLILIFIQSTFTFSGDEPEIYLKSARSHKVEISADILNALLNEKLYGIHDSILDEFTTTSEPQTTAETTTFISTTEENYINRINLVKPNVSSPFEIENQFDWMISQREQLTDLFSSPNTTVIDVRNIEEQNELALDNEFDFNAKVIKIDYYDLEIEENVNRAIFSSESNQDGPFLIICGHLWCGCRWQWFRFWGYNNVFWMHDINRQHLFLL